MIALIISILLQIGIITNENQYNNASESQKTEYKKIIEDDIQGI